MSDSIVGFIFGCHGYSLRPCMRSMESNWSKFLHAVRMASAKLTNFLSSPTCILMSLTNSCGMSNETLACQTLYASPICNRVVLPQYSMAAVPEEQIRWLVARRLNVQRIPPVIDHHADKHCTTVSCIAPRDSLSRRNHRHTWTERRETFVLESDAKLKGRLKRPPSPSAYGNGVPGTLSRFF